MFLIDTNVVSELRKIDKGRADEHVTYWAGTAKPSSLFLSAITIQEIETGIFLTERKDAFQGRLLRRWFEDGVLTTFRDRILPVDTRVARQCASLHIPNPTSFRDAYIAATAIVHDMTVVTRNVADFASTAVRLLNPWNFDGSH
ncbi:MAG: type II toxin-antitoxin system VapC family toxin [Rhizobiaceae bacterium]